jgi:hypothetical protein
MAQKIFIVVADLTYVGKFCELEFEHATPQKGLAASISTGGTEGHSCVDLYHGPMWVRQNPGLSFRGAMRRGACFSVAASMLLAKSRFLDCEAHPLKADEPLRSE